MVPAAYVRMEVMPLSPNGKLDRRALPEPEGDAYALREYEAPQGEMEEVVAEIWSELLGVERVGRQDNFFELGGHSLLAVQVAARIRQRLGMEDADQQLFLRDLNCGRSPRWLFHRGFDPRVDRCHTCAGTERCRYSLTKARDETAYAWSLLHTSMRTSRSMLIPAVPEHELRLRTVHAMAQRMVELIRFSAACGTLSYCWLLIRCGSRL